MWAENVGAMSFAKSPNDELERGFGFVVPQNAAGVAVPEFHHCSQW
jgi:hypothetical protein